MYRFFWIDSCLSPMRPALPPDRKSDAAIFSSCVRRLTRATLCHVLQHTMSVPESLPVLRVRDPIVEIGGEPFSPDRTSLLADGSEPSIGAPFLKGDGVRDFL